MVRFTLQGAEKTFTYTVTVTAERGGRAVPMSFSGVLRETDWTDDDTNQPVGGDDHGNGGRSL